jgi:hypothetical protein
MIRLLRSRGPAGWHTHLHGLATQNYEMFGLRDFVRGEGLSVKSLLGGVR